MSNEDSYKLEEAFIEEEVHDALLDPNKDKARGPNGFSLTFWQYCWDFVKELLALYKDFLARCTFDSKRKGFKPLSLVGSLYKILAKGPSNRLQKVIGKVVSKS